MTEPLLVETGDWEVSEYYDDPSEETLVAAARYLDTLEGIVENFNEYRRLKRKQGEVEGFLESGYEPEDHIGLAFQVDEDRYNVIDSYVIEEKQERITDELRETKGEIAEQIASIRAWDEDVEEGDGLVKAVSMAYSVVTHTFADDSEAHEQLESFKEEHQKAYELLDSYAQRRKSIVQEEDVLDSFISRPAARFQRDGMFGMVTAVVLEGVDQLDEMYEEEETRGRALAHTVEERRTTRSMGEETVQPFDYQVELEMDRLTEEEMMGVDEPGRGIV